MKTFTVLVASLLLGGARLVPAGDPGTGAVQPNVFIDLQIVALPRETALPLIRELMDREKIEGAYARIQELLDEGNATLVGWPMVTTRSGQRAVIEAIDELPYGSDFTTGGISISVNEEAGPGGPTPASKLVANQEVTIEGAEFNSIPTSFQTQPLGITLQVDPVISADEKTIQLEIVPQRVRLKGMTKIAVEHEKTHEKVLVEQPEVETAKTTTTVTLKSGERILYGVYPGSEATDRLELFLLRAELRKAP